MERYQDGDFDTKLNNDVTYGYHAVAIDEKRKKFPVSLWDENRKTDHQTIEQVWFSGVHSDVGGSYAEMGLSDIALKWMLEKAKDQGLHLRRNWATNLNPDPSGTMHDSRQGLWSIWRPATRNIPRSALIHKSVFERQNNPDNKYQPQNLPDEYTTVA